MLPNTGKNLPIPIISPGQDYASAIAAALHAELGGTNHAIKTIMKWTGASDRTAKNWLSGSYGPSGNHLIQLARQSDSVFRTVLELIGRQQHVVGSDLLTIRQELIEATGRIETLIGPGACK